MNKQRILTELEKKDFQIKMLEAQLQAAKQPRIVYENLGIWKFIRKNYFHKYYPVLMLVAFFTKGSLLFWSKHLNLTVERFWLAVLWLFSFSRKLW